MQDKPYFCPNCRSNRVKFSVISSTSQDIFKDAVTGEITKQDTPQPLATQEPSIRCRVCGFTGNELRFIKQAERNPRVMTVTSSSYS